MDVQEVKEIEVVEEPKKVSKLTKVKNFVTANLVEICGAVAVATSVGASVVTARNSNKVAKSSVAKNKAMEKAARVRAHKAIVDERLATFEFQKEYGRDAANSILGISHSDRAMSTIDD